MAQQGHLRLDPAGRREPSKGIAAKDAVTGDQDRQRVRPTGLPHSLRGRTHSFRDLAIGPRLAHRDVGHRPAHLDVQSRTPIEGQVEPRKATVKIGCQLPRRLDQKRRPLTGISVPVKPDQKAAALDQRHRAKARQDDRPGRVGNAAHPLSRPP